MNQIYTIFFPLGLSEQKREKCLFDQLPSKVHRLLRQGYSLKLVKKSLDARKKDRICWVCRYEVIPNTEQVLISRVFPSLHNQKKNSELGEKYPKTRPIVIGLGPSGLFAALYLARTGLKPIILEQGEAVEERLKTVKEFWDTGVLNSWSNVQYGEGGAGTFSDGKLNTGITSPWIRLVFEDLVHAGAPEDILVDAHPHVGTDLLPRILQNIRAELLDHGAEIYFCTSCTRIETLASDRYGIHAKKWSTGENLFWESSVVFLAPGHSARSLYKSLAEEGFALESKAMAVGLRIEHFQEQIDLAQYGRENCLLHRIELPPCSYKLTGHASNGRAVYSFCMCPGGEVIACSSAPGQVVTNGMSRYARNSIWANSALLVQVTPEDYQAYLEQEVLDLEEWEERSEWEALAHKYPALAGIYFQEILERRIFALTGRTYSAAVMTLEDFLDQGKSNVKVTTGLSKLPPFSYKPSVVQIDFRSSLPDYIIKSIQEVLPYFGKKISQFDNPKALLYAVESRSSAPLRILRDPTTRAASGHPGVFPIGEGAGYAGGITSSAVDGLKSVVYYLKQNLNFDLERTFFHENTKT